MNLRFRSFVESDPLEDFAPVVLVSVSYSDGEKSSVGTLDNDAVASGSTAGLGDSAGGSLGARGVGVGCTLFIGGFWDMNRTGWARARRGIVLVRRENILGNLYGVRVGEPVFEVFGRGWPCLFCLADWHQITSLLNSQSESQVKVG